MGVQFVTHLKIERVETHEGAGERQVGKILVQTGRQVTEVGSVTVKASSLAALARKIGAHVELFDDDVINEVGEAGSVAPVGRRAPHGVLAV